MQLPLSVRVHRRFLSRGVKCISTTKTKGPCNGSSKAEERRASLI